MLGGATVVYSIMADWLHCVHVFLQLAGPYAQRKQDNCCSGSHSIQCIPHHHLCVTSLTWECKCDETHYLQTVSMNALLVSVRYNYCLVLTCIGTRLGDPGCLVLFSLSLPAKLRPETKGLVFIFGGPHKFFFLFLVKIYLKMFAIFTFTKKSQKGKIIWLQFKSFFFSS